MNGVLGLIDGIDIESAHDLGCDARFTIEDAHHFVTTRVGGVGFQSVEMRQRATIIVFHATNVLASRTIPYPEEDGLQLVDHVTF